MIRYSNEKPPQNNGNNNNGNNSNKKNFNNKNSIFVANLSFKTNDNKLKEFFEDCGKILEIRIAKNEKNQSRGFAHIDFEDEDGVNNAIKKSGSNLDGRDIRVEKSGEPRKNNGGGFSGKKNFGGNRNNNNNNKDNYMDKAKKSGAIISTGENKVTTFDSDDDDE